MSRTSKRPPEHLTGKEGKKNAPFWSGLLTHFFVIIVTTTISWTVLTFTDDNTRFWPVKLRTKFPSLGIRKSNRVCIVRTSADSEVNNFLLHGTKNFANSGERCCSLCKRTERCHSYLYCAHKAGCFSGVFGECW